MGGEVTQYSSFYDAYKAMHPEYNPWTQQQQQQLATAYSSLNPTWQPPAGSPVTVPPPVKFDPYGDASYAAGASAVTNANTHAGAERDYQQHAGAQAYGIDANGNPVTSGADLNPYAQAAIMKRNYDNSVRGTNNSYAAQGQLYSGARLNAQDANDFNYGASSDALKRQAQGFYHGQDLNVQNTADSGIAQLAALLGPAFANFLATQRGT